MISSIQYIGNTKTQDFILEREIHHPINVFLDSTTAKEDRNRLDNLGIFSEVTWKVVPLEDEMQYCVSVLSPFKEHLPWHFPRK
ncbi:hypothetical protein Ct9H90mP29_04270 [bacterium]|nr:MAG: hypothetical protein Ct9H90mP29_04270 [bacterium]